MVEKASKNREAPAKHSSKNEPLPAPSNDFETLPLNSSMGVVKLQQLVGNSGVKQLLSQSNLRHQNDPSLAKKSLPPVRGVATPKQDDDKSDDYQDIELPGSTQSVRGWADTPPADNNTPQGTSNITWIGQVLANKPINHLKTLDFVAHVQRNGETTDAPPPNTSTAPRTERASMSVSFHGLSFQAPAGALFEAGAKLPQHLTMALRRLIGSQFQAGLESQAEAHLQSSGSFEFLSNDGQLVAEAGNPIPDFRIDAGLATRLISWLESQEFEVEITTDQRDILGLGIAAEEAWGALHNPALEEIFSSVFPPWFSRDLFFSRLASNAALLRRFQEVAAAFQTEQSEANREAVIAALNDIVNALTSETVVLDAIREDAQLVSEPGYQMLWPMPREADEEDPPPRTQPAQANDTLNERVATQFLAFVNTQERLGTQCFAEGAEGHQARLELIQRFFRFLQRSTGSASGDQPIAEVPGRANAPIIPSQLHSSPSLEPPLFDAALNIEYRFLMALQFADVFDAFASYAYRWELVKVPEEAILRNADVTQLEGQTPDSGDAAGAAFGRTARYALADIERAVDSFGTSLGPSGIGAIELAAANAILRFVGTTLRTVFRTLTKPANEEDIVFSEPGLYIVRVMATPIGQDEAEVTRPPSVAYMPVFARAAADMAATRTQSDVAGRDATLARITELEQLLARPDGVENREDLQKELADLKTSVSDLGTVLQDQIRRLTEKRDNLPAHHSERRQLDDQITRLQQMLEVRQGRQEERGLDGAERIIGTFVSDEGQVVRLNLEAIRRQSEGPATEYYVSDLTTPNSTEATGTGPDKAQAIRHAVQTILESQQGYGRGECDLSIDGRSHHLRIEASMGSILMEAIENVSTVLAIATVAAAPFTGGASLTLLLPIGAIGAIPSAYRIASRVSDSTFRFDLNLAMDVVNIVGGVIGLAHAATPLRMVRMGTALMVMGLGADGLGVLVMGAGIMEQIEALDGLPPGLRMARLMDIMSQAMLNAGIMVGGALAQRARAREAHARAGGTEDGAGRPRETDGHTVDPATGRTSLPDPGGEALGRAPSADPDHHITVSPTGELIRCSPFCQRLRTLYQEEIAANGDFHSRLHDLETRSRNAARERDPARARELADQVAVDGAILERAMRHNSYERLQAEHGLTPAQVAEVRGAVVEAPHFSRLLDAGMPLEQALDIARRHGSRGVQMAEQVMRRGSVPPEEVIQRVDEFMERTSSSRPLPGTTTAPEVTRRFEGDTLYDAYAQARADAQQEAGMGEQQVDFIQEFGPQAGRVTGRMSPDGSRGWRLDFDPSNPNKGLHINWWRTEEGVMRRGASGIDAQIKIPAQIREPQARQAYRLQAMEAVYLSILEHYPSPSAGAAR